MDMVCEKTPDSDHDFTRDPIRILRDGDWLKADRTTLGADNGIAIALALALAEDVPFRIRPLNCSLQWKKRSALAALRASNQACSQEKR